MLCTHVFTINSFFVIILFVIIDNPQSGWRCPCCQTMSTVIPSVYKCFCGRLNNPGQSRRKGDLTVPHSCGETCGRRLGSSLEALCRHKCQQLCHPGPCPPCAAMVTRTCPCGKERYREMERGKRERERERRQKDGRRERESE